MENCTTICIVRVWALLLRSPVQDMLLEGVLHAFCKIVVPIGAPIGAPCGHFWQLFQGSDFGGGFVVEMGGPAAGAGPAKFVFARSCKRFYTKPTAAGPRYFQVGSLLAG